MKHVRVFNEENLTQTRSLFEWADRCGAFFLMHGVFPPLEWVKKFSEGGELNYGMTAYVQWVGFDFCRDDYLVLFNYLKKKYPSLKMHVGKLDHQLLTFEDLDIWRQEIAYGLPFDKHKNLLNECNELEMKFRGLLEKGFEREAYAVYDKLLNAQMTLQLFISNKNHDKK